MMEIMEKLHCITEHVCARVQKNRKKDNWQEGKKQFQKQNFMSSSNKIAKSTNDIVTVFTDAVIKFTPDQMIMENEVGIFSIT